jgi:hypothetical protein
MKMLSWSVAVRQMLAAIYSQLLILREVRSNLKVKNYLQKIFLSFQDHVTLVMQLIFGQIQYYEVNSEYVTQVICSPGCISIIAHFLKAFDFIITWEYNTDSM